MATPITDAADLPDGGFETHQTFAEDGRGAAIMTRSLADRVIEAANVLFGSYSSKAARLDRQADEMTTSLLRAAAGLIGSLAGKHERSAPAQPSRNAPAPAAPASPAPGPASVPMPAPFPVPAGGGTSCSSSSGSWQCHNGSTGLMLFVLAGMLALGVPRGSTRFFQDVLKPNSIIPQVAERPG
ncbi:MAG TPA: hypothetical protein VFJ72_13990 [Rubrobacteraceae bacterium]|nr:hypothetical protein [Rubrobacteraceae bacterium]